MVRPPTEKTTARLRAVGLYSAGQDDRPVALTVSTGNYDHNLWCSIRFLASTSGKGPAE